MDRFSRRFYQVSGAAMLVTAVLLFAGNAPAAGFVAAIEAAFSIWFFASGADSMRSAKQLARGVRWNVATIVVGVLFMFWTPPFFAMIGLGVLYLLGAVSAFIIQIPEVGAELVKKRSDQFFENLETDFKN